MTRLEEHRKALEEADGLGALLRFEELEHDEIKLFNSSFTKNCQERDPADITQLYAAYVQTLHEWGIMCPHPQSQRLYNGYLASESPRLDDIWYFCKLCNCAVINR